MRIIRILLESLVDSLLTIDMSSRKQRRRMLASASVPGPSYASKKEYKRERTLREIRYDAEHRIEQQREPQQQPNASSAVENHAVSDERTG